MTSTELILAAAVTILGGAGFWNWIANRGKAKVDLIALGQTISGEIIKALKAEREELLGKVADLGGQVRDLQDDVRGLSQHVGALESMIRELGAVPPPRPKRKAAE